MMETEGLYCHVGTEFYTSNSELCLWTFRNKRVVTIFTFFISMCYVGERLACRELPNNSFLFPYCMVSIIPEFPLEYFTRVYCLVCVMHKLKSGY